VLTAAAPRWQTPAWPAMTPGPGSASRRGPAVRLPRSCLCLLTGYLQAVYLRKQAQIQQLPFFSICRSYPESGSGSPEVIRKCAAMRRGCGADRCTAPALRPVCLDDSGCARAWLLIVLCRVSAVRFRCCWRGGIGGCPVRPGMRRLRPCRNVLLSLSGGGGVASRGSFLS